MLAREIVDLARKACEAIMKLPRLVILLAVAATFGIGNCASHDAPGESVQELALAPTALSQRYPHPYLKTPLGFDPSQSSSLATLQKSPLALDARELGVLAEKGFVISDRLSSPSFLMLYAEAYKHHLPVYVTADSLLHAFHKSYDSILQAVEESVLLPLTKRMLLSLRRSLADHRGDSQAREDLDIFLAVALSLLEARPMHPVAGADPGVLRHLLQLTHSESMEDIELFGTRRIFDFSQLKPRGHYDRSESLTRYFQAMMWLGRADFRLVDTSCHGERTFRRRELEAAVLLASLLERRAQKQWDLIDQILSTFTAPKDQMDVRDVQSFARGLAGGSLSRLRKVPDEAIQERLLSPTVTQQKIASYPRYKCNEPDSPLALSVSFALFPQRHSPESEVMSRVTHDRIAAPRQLPVPLDVAFAALENDQAGELLAPELLRWEYEDDLIRSREQVSRPSDGGLYLGWIDALRALSVAPGEFDGLPVVARTEPWGRRLIQTQLASWAELRRDTILYAKQSYGTILCEYPDGYVDPYPKFYARMAEMARSGQRLTKTLGVLGPVFDCRDRHLIEDRECRNLFARIGEYFGRLLDTSLILGDMARREREGLRLEPAQVEFLNRAVSASPICGGYVTDGWYAHLFFDQDTSVEFSPTIADVHTDPNDSPRVLYVGTGAPRLMAVAIESGNDSRVYVGPVSSYYELVGGLQRFTDDTWREQLLASPRREVPWVRDMVVQETTPGRGGPLERYWSSVPGVREDR